MVQKKLPLINSAHGSETRNIINEIIKLLNSLGQTYDGNLSLARETLIEAKKWNELNKNVQQQINTLIAESGTSDAEVLQARTDINGVTHTVLNDRLDESEDRVYDTQKVINVLHHGAVGDGVTDDWAAIQGAIELAEVVRRNVYLPGNDFYCSKTLRSEHKTSPHWTSGIRIFGDGKNTKIIGTGQKVVDYSDLKNADKGAAFAFHGGNNIVENMTFSQCTVGVFYGQSPTTTVPSSVSFNTIENIWMENVGTGILKIHASGNNYNRTRNIHILNCQIGVHLGKGVVLDQFNNNRNVYQNIRVSRAWIGYLVEQADGCAFDNLYAEGLVVGGTQFGPRPSQLPAVLGDKPTAVVVLDGQYNFFDKVGVENCAWHLYSEGFKNSFVNMMVRDDSKARSLVMFPNPNRQPLNFTSDTQINPVYTYQPDNGIHFEGSNGAAIKTRMFDMGHHWQSHDPMELSEDIESIANASSMMARRMAGMWSVFVNIRFKKAAALSVDGKFRMKIPHEEKLRFSNIFIREVSTNITFTFPVMTGVTGVLSNVTGRFSTTNEANAYGGYHFIIDPPSQGWNETGEFNNIIFQMHYYAE